MGLVGGNLNSINAACNFISLRFSISKEINLLINPKEIITIMIIET